MSRAPCRACGQLFWLCSWIFPTNNSLESIYPSSPVQYTIGKPVDFPAKAAPMLGIMHSASIYQGQAAQRKSSPQTIVQSSLQSLLSILLSKSSIQALRCRRANLQQIAAGWIVRWPGRDNGKQSDSTVVMHYWMMMVPVGSTQHYYRRCQHTHTHTKASSISADALSTSVSPLRRAVDRLSLS